MKRRDFLKFAAAAPALGLVPLPSFHAAAPGGITVACLRRIVDELNANIVENYYAVMHPQVWLDLRRLEARSLWSIEYRKWREHRRRGERIETLREVMERVQSELEGYQPWLRSISAQGEFGIYENFRFIQSKELPA